MKRGPQRNFFDILLQGQAGGYCSIRDPQLTASVIKAMVQDWYLKRSNMPEERLAWIDTHGSYCNMWKASFYAEVILKRMDEGFARDHEK